MGSSLNVLALVIKGDMNLASLGSQSGSPENPAFLLLGNIELLALYGAMIGSVIKVARCQHNP